MKYFILVLSMLMTASAWSQELPFLFKGRVENTDVGGYEGGVSVSIVQSGGTLFSAQTASNGKYTLRGNINYGVAFDVVFSKGGLVSKKVHFDLSDMNEEDIPPGEVRPIEALDMTMFKVRANIDFSFLDTEPVASFDWNTRQMSAGLDAVAMNKMKAKIEKLLLQEEKDKAEKEAAYLEAMFQADAAYDAEEYPKSLEKYKEALGYKPNEEKPKTRIIELEALIKAQEDANAAEAAAKAAYDKLITDADNLRDAGNLEAALPKYKEAATKTDEVYPDDQIKILTKQIAQAKKEAESQAAYDAAMKSGAGFLKQGSLRAAKDKYTEASKLKPSEALPKAKLKEIEDKLKASEEKEANKQKYDNALAAADILFGKEDWQGAKDKYEEALSYETASSYAKGRKKICDDNLASADAEKAKQEQILVLLAAGDASMTNKAYQDAVNSFTEVLNLESEHPEGTQKLALANQKLEEASSQAAKEKDFNDLVEQGDQKFGAKSYQESIDKYEAAIAIIPSAEVSKKLTEARAKLKEETELAEKSVAFNKLIEEGNQLMSSDKLIEAKAKFTQAGKIDSSSDIPTTKIIEIDALLADQKSLADKQAKYDELVNAANSLFDTEKWTAAEAKYVEALNFTDDKSYAEGRIAEIKNKQGEEKSLADKKAKYDGLIAEANQLFNGKKWDDADTKYKAALTFTDDKAYAEGRIEEIKNIKAGEQAVADKQAKYEELVDAANKLYDAQKWTESETKYKEALGFTDDRTYAEGRIDDIQKKIAGDQADADKQAKYEELIADANGMFDGKNWNDAQLKYKEALNYTDDKSFAEGKLAEIKIKLGEEQEAANEQAKITSLLQEGKNLYNSKKLDDAKSKYEEVLKLDGSNTEASTEIDKINTELASMMNEAQKEEDFNKLRDEGYALAGAKDYSNAKLKLQEALTLKDDTAVKAKIAEIEKIEKEQGELAEKDQEYNGLISAAEGLDSSGKYNEAIAKYKEALAVKPTESAPLAKIAELEAKLKDGEAQAVKDKEYDDLMKKGEDLMSQEKYLDAIREFNLALAVKPTEQAPVTRASEAERLAKESTSDEDHAIQKNLRIAEEKMNEGNYDRASSILDATEKTRPNEPRIKELRDQIKALRKIDKDYDDLMAAGNGLAGAKDYAEAKEKFEDASKKKPELQLPKDKIKEMKNLIDQQASAAQKDQLYNDYMTRGGKMKSSKEYEMALSAYQDALSVRPGDAPAKNKINEIQQILDNIANADASAIQRKNEFDVLIKKADILFASTTYPKAKGVYEEALAIFSDNSYAQLQVEECIRLSRQESSAEEERAYRKVIAVADKNFGEENYEKAIMRYRTAVSLRDSDPYPKQKLAEIDAILNPQTLESAKLVDPGTPYSGSILDGGTALQDAEAQRKQLNKLAVQNKFEAIHTENEEMTSQKMQDHYDNSNEIYQTQMEISLDAGESDLGRQETVNALRIAEDEIMNTRRNNIQFEHSENVSDQEVLYMVNQEVALEYGVRDEEHLKNADVMYQYNGALADAAKEKILTEQDENYTSDRRLRDAMHTVESEMIDDFEERNRVRQEVYDTRQAVEIDYAADSRDNYERLIETQEAVDASLEVFTDKQAEDRQIALGNNEVVKNVNKDIYEANDALVGIEDVDHYSANKTLDEIKDGVDSKTAEDIISVQENNDHLVDVKTSINKAETAQGKIETAQAYQADRDMALIKLEMIDEQDGMDDNRKATTEILKDEHRDYAESHYEDYNNQMERSLSNRAVIEDSKELFSEVDAIAEEAHAQKVSYVEAMDKKAQADFSGIEISDEAERLNTQKAVGNVYEAVGIEAKTGEGKQVESEQALEATKRVISKKDANEAIGEKEKHYDAADKIHNINNEPEEKVKVANSLGEEYPEGVSQESFSQNDQNGLMTSVITRRVVVIEGHADVYLRTQTLHGITYSKNGKPTTSNTWNSETQGPHLERHY